MCCSYNFICHFGEQMHRKPKIRRYVMLLVMQYTCNIPVGFASFVLKRTKSQQFILFFFSFFISIISYYACSGTAPFSELSFQQDILQTWSVSWTSRSKGRKYFTLRCESHRGETMHNILVEYNCW